MAFDNIKENKDNLIGKLVVDERTTRTGILHKDHRGYYIELPNGLPLPLRSSDIKSIN